MVHHLMTRRRAATLLGGTLAAAAGPSFAQPDPGSGPNAVVQLSDEASRGDLGVLEVTYYGPTPTRAPKQVFRFPDDADPSASYGIDISHYDKEIPWSDLQAARVDYVYAKTSQGIRGVDATFAANWQAAQAAGLPRGAYHFMSAGVDGAAQANFFIKQLNAAGGLQSGDLQPVLDLEWDNSGPNFQKVQIGTDADGRPVYKDYWDDYKDQLVPTLQSYFDALLTGLQPLLITPIIYTSRTYWANVKLKATDLPACNIWVCDYGNKSYANKAPRAVRGHAFNLWQFTSLGSIKVGDKTYDGFDCNMAVNDGLDALRIP
jgi:GH25 family lysozyme M1 (1,4-beta-N-acetylmuramidase)